jgi:hypothetical protein
MNIAYLFKGTGAYCHYIQKRICISREALFFFMWVENRLEKQVVYFRMTGTAQAATFAALLSLLQMY